MTQRLFAVVFITFQEVVFVGLASSQTAKFIRYLASIDSCYSIDVSENWCVKNG